jgi:dihydroorotate dehydrogenase (fumarate)
MANLKSTYMGIELKNPVIIGACNLMQDVAKVKEMEEAGAAAIVYKSIFEEQLQLEEMQMQDDLSEYNERHAEMTTLFPGMKHAGPKEFLMNLKKVKDAVNIPVIASINAIYKDTWVDYAKQIEEVGVDALELNFYSIPKDASMDEFSIIENEISIAKAVKDAVKIPVSVKLSPYYTNVLNVIEQLDKNKTDGFVLFNSLFQPEIDIESEEHYYPIKLSNKGDYKLPLRFAGLLYNKTKADVCASKGIFEGSDVVKLLLAGADVTQVVSVLYKNGISHVSKILSDLEKWMDSKGYKTINDFKGKLSKEKLNDPFAYKRAQYVDILMNSDEILRKHPVV